MDAKLVHVTAVLDKVAAEMLGLEASSLSSAANAASASSARKRSAATPGPRRPRPRAAHAPRRRRAPARRRTPLSSPRSRRQRGGASRRSHRRC